MSKNYYKLNVIEQFENDYLPKGWKRLNYDSYSDGTKIIFYREGYKTLVFTEHYTIFMNEPLYTLRRYNEMPIKYKKKIA